MHTAQSIKQRCQRCGVVYHFARIIVVVIMTLLIGCSKKVAPSRPQMPSIVSVDNEKILSKRYRGNFEIPNELYTTYEELTVAFRVGNQKSIESHCLPFSVEIATAARPPAEAEIGTDINLLFARQGFEPEILSARQEGEDTILLRTGTSIFWFVQTKRGAWRLYAYRDAPVQ